MRADVAAQSQLATLFDLLQLGPAPQEGDELPPLAHWLYFHAWGRMSETTESGDFLDPALPPIELPRRLCVERNIRFHRPIRVGDPIWRFAHIVDAAERAGEAGPLVTLRLRHDIADCEGVAISEDRRVLYMARGEPLPVRPFLALRSPAIWLREYRADPRALFSYSALTRDKSRVHYDRPFATFVEGHPGLVVQTDLAATLLLDLLREHAPNARLIGCELHTRRWLHDTGPLSPLRASARNGRRRPMGGGRARAPRHRGGGEFGERSLGDVPSPGSGKRRVARPREPILNART